MKHYQKFFLPIVIGLMVWTSALLFCGGGGLGTNPGSSSCPPNLTSVLPWLPLLALVGFGVYSVAYLTWSVLNFNDCDGAVVELDKQIKEARESLKTKGFKFR